MAFINLEALKPGARPPPRPKKSTDDAEYAYPELNKPVINAQRTPRQKPNKFLDEATVAELQAQIEVLQGSVEVEKARADKEVKERRSSNAFLSKRMMSAILDAEQANRNDSLTYEQQIKNLEETIRNLEARLANASTSEVDEQSRGRAMSNYTQKMWKHLLDAESETHEYQDKIKALEQENEMLRNELTQINAMRGRSFTEYSQRMWRHLLEAEHDTTEQEQQWKRKIAELEAQLSAERETVKQVERTRRESVSEVSRKMFRHLLNAEEDAKQDKTKDQLVIEGLRTEITQMNREMDGYKHLLAVERDRTQELDRDRAGSIKFLATKRMNDLLEAEEQSSEEIEAWKRKVDLLEAEVRLYQQQMARLEDERENGEHITPGGPTQGYMGDPDDYDGMTPGGPDMMSTPGGPMQHVTPGGYEGDLFQRIAELEQEVEYLRQSKMTLVQRTADEIDSLRNNLTTMGQHISRRHRARSRSRDSRPSWAFW